ncbi:DUF2249 domain-containing protein [Blastococcus saxobsidens]|uniref:Hemerythrin HHE cation binding domain protein n=1 Tax=Blastococcus saxobsidens (strain DD2) TaxID=1146883 RepID=H6RU59_BLASD|nr:DUF2249 domain-containing protein [Blastococcus saxobsidens]CCG05666.1 Hemerythrin HHE cation binding domain protein [Blastococcus saxobsidens DD2]
MTTTLPPGAIDMVLASDADDAAAIEAVRQHHAELAGRLAVHVDALLAAATAPGAAGFRQARAAALGFLGGDLLPHAAAEERALYPAAARSERLRLLVEAMTAEHRVLEELVRELDRAVEPAAAAAGGHALRVLFDAHLAKENDLVLPVLAADPAVSLAGVLAGMHELLGEGGHDHDHDHDAAVPPVPAKGSCGCGGHDDDDIPVLDVRAVPHAIRHATVFGAFDAVPDGGSLLLVAPHDPLPLLRQLSARAGGALAVDYEERGPDAWRLRLTRA